MNKNKKIISLSVILFVVMLLVSGGSFAYWTWVTAASERTNVSLTITAPDMSAKLTGYTQNITNLIPVSSCTDETYAIKKELTLTYSNLSTNDGEILGTLSIENFVSPYGTPDSEDLSHLHYSITRTPNNCESGPIVGMSGTFTSTSGNLFTNQKLVELITPGTNEASTTFYLWVWLDNEYTHQNVGSGVVSDPMQDISFTLTWSGMINNDLVSTEIPAYITYDKTDNTLRISKGNNNDSASPMNNTPNKNNVFMPKYMDDLYNVDMVENDNVYFDLENKSYTAEQLPWHEYREEIKRVIFEDDISPINMRNWFSGMTNVEYIDVSKVNTSRVTSMFYLFPDTGHDASTFQIVGLDNWNTSNVTNMEWMFSGAGYNATTFNIGNLSNWNTSKVTSMRRMFASAGYNSTTWNIGDLSNWNVSNVIDMAEAFNSAGYSATTFNIGNLSNWDVSKVTNMEYMFLNAGYNATSWNIGNLLNWDVSNVTIMKYMFSNAGRNATNFSLNLSNWDVSNVTSMEYMFNYAGYSATTWNVGDLSEWDTSNVTNMAAMFNYAGYNATNFSLNLSGWDVIGVTNFGFWYTGRNATNFSLNLSNWNLSGITSTSQFFYNTGSDATNFSLNLSGWQFLNVTSMRGMFGNMCQSSNFCEIIGLEGWNVSNVTDMNWMFQGVATHATTFNIGNISGWNTSNVVDMSRMFWTTGQNATNFSLDLSEWNVDLVTSYEFFNMYVESKVTPPVWVN